MTNSKEKKHIAVFAFPFGSHPIPLFNLVLKLAHASPNFHFSFFGTQHSNHPLLSIPHIPHTITFHTVWDGLPEGGNIPGSHPVERVNLFLQAAPDNLLKAVEETGQTFTCIIADAFVTPSLILAQQFNVPWIPIWLPLSSSLCAHFHTHLIRQNCANNVSGDTLLDFLPGLSKMRVDDLPEDVVKANCGEDESETLFSKTLASLGSVLPQAKAVVVNFFEELDPPLLVEDMKSKLKPFLYVGFLSLSLPLPPLPPSHTDATGCLSWLDNHKGGSVAYVSFGTVVTPPPHEVLAVAEALEACGFPFLWSLKDHVKEFLPIGFLERTKNRGKILPWVPQTQVLGHGSVGVFVTHSGCNSVYESISNGVPMICRPFFGDHGMTAWMVEDVWEIGVRVEGGVFTKDGLPKSLNLILVQEEGKKMKENVMQLKKTVLDAAGPQGSAAQDFQTLVELVSTS
ncbi:hypothetical protein VNO77_22178 [Canavalia gladiata]|uniref:Glycosyltransferase n=1 Tax=Canavalia gladiata TaxID=3824 RepID=A0AAN9QAJ6_CANGL